MQKAYRPSGATLLAVAFSAAVAIAILTDRSALIEPAQAQTDAEKQKSGQDRQKAGHPKEQPPPSKAPAYQAPPRATAPPSEKPPAKSFQKLPPETKPAGPPPGFEPKRQEGIKRPDPPSVAPLPSTTPQPEIRKATPSTTKPGPEGPAAGTKLPPPGFEPKRQEGIRRPIPPSVAPVPSTTPQPEIRKAAPSTTKPPAFGPEGPAAGTKLPPHGPVAAPGPAPQHFEDVRKGRLERIESGRKVIQEPGNRFIVKEDNKKAIIRHDEAERFLRRPGAKTERRADGNVETYYVRPDGVRIVTIVDQHGRLLRRYRRDRDGHEHSIIDNRRFYRNVAIGIGVGALGIIVLNLPPPRVTIPRDRYIVEYDRASDDDLDEALMASPLEPLERAYSLDEIRYTYELRARMRRIDLDTIIFDSGAWEVPQDQYYKLERVARAILRVLRHNEEAVFLIEGHTDAVGSDEDNLSLSDRRAQSVAEILSETFGVPPENLVTQGYGEQFLKIDTPGPEPLNRRVTIVNITRLMAER